MQVDRPQPCLDIFRVVVWRTETSTGGLSCFDVGGGGEIRISCLGAWCLLRGTSYNVSGEFPLGVVASE